MRKHEYTYFGTDYTMRKHVMTYFGIALRKTRYKMFSVLLMHSVGPWRSEHSEQTPLGVGLGAHGDGSNNILHKFN